MEKPLLGLQQLNVLNFLISTLNILLKFSLLSRLIQKSILSPTSWEDGLYRCASRPLFRQIANQSPKNAGTIHFLLKGQSGVSRKGWEDGLWSSLADFSSNDSEPANRKKDFHANHRPKN
jgi:hypothetical protein